MFNAEINVISSSQIGVKYLIIWCIGAGILPAESRERIELLPGNEGKAFPGWSCSGESWPHAVMVRCRKS